MARTIPMSYELLRSSSCVLAIVAIITLLIPASSLVMSASPKPCAAKTLPAQLLANRCLNDYRKLGFISTTCPKAWSTPKSGPAGCCTSTDCQPRHECLCLTGCRTPVCLFKPDNRCPPLAPPVNGYLKNNRGVAHVFCNVGFSRHGPATQRCHNGKWTPAPQCRPRQKTCYDQRSRFEQIYKLLTWKQARKWCRGRGGELAYPLDPRAAQCFVQQKMKGWIGAKYPITGTPKEVYWKLVTRRIQKKHNCGFLRKGSLKWRVSTCSRKRQFICQFRK